MNQQMAVVVHQLTAILGISQQRLAGFKAARAALEAKATPGGIPGPGLADAPALKAVEAEINAEQHIEQLIGSWSGVAPAEGVPAQGASGLLLDYLNWDVNDDNRSALGLPPVDPDPIPTELAAYANSVVQSTFGTAFSFAPLPKGSAPGATAINPTLPPGSNSPWGVI